MTERSRVALNRRNFTREGVAIIAALVGGPLIATLCTLGTLGVVVLLEAWLSPPLTPNPNYGQFGATLLLLSSYGLVVGLSLALIPYLKFSGWLTIFAISAIVMLKSQYTSGIGEANVLLVALGIIDLVIIMLAFLFSSLCFRPCGTLAVADNHLK